MACTATSHQMALTDEFRFLVDCCHFSFARRDSSPIHNLDRPLDWPRVLDLARFHRVQGLVSYALSSFPETNQPQVAADIQADAEAIAAHNLRLTWESKRLLTAFSGAGAPLVFLKGLPLGVLAYGNPAFKSAIDIDLLVDPADLQTAAELLADEGYALIAPRRRDLRAWHLRWKESVWAKADLQIDLHTRTADNPRLIHGVGAHSPRQLVKVAEGLELPTLADDELFAYLAVHGASSAWFRLKWLSDFAGFLCSRSAEELQHLYRRSQELAAGRAAGQALLLADELFGTLASHSALANELRRDRATVSLFRTAFKLLTGVPGEPTDRLFGTFPIHRSQFQLLPGMSYRLSELSHQAARMLTRVP